ncbi:MAG TPA: PAS domain S-box protein, partial [Geobacteraceae bacterium]|nr:PAS domain S-box protein [Geobacteraceae bacterium]
EKWTLVSAGLIEYRGKPAGIVTMFDITDRKRMEEDLQHAYDDLEKRVHERTEELAEAVTALRNSDAHYRAIVDTFDGLIYICSQDYRIEFMNNKLIERTGYEAVGELCFKVLHDRDSACPWCVNDRVFAGETVRWEMLSPKDNCWYYVVNVPVYHANGSISKHSMIMDITERKRAEEALRESEARLKIAMDLAKLGPWEYDDRTGLFSFDDQFYALYGTTAEREGGTLMPAEVYSRKFIPPEESAIVANGIAEVQANLSIQLEHRIIRADGEERFIIVRAEAVFNQEGRFVKIRGANQDITERKLAEGRLQRKREQLEELNRTLETRVQEEVAKNRGKDIILIQQNRQAALGELMEHIAHQWKQPLNVINLIIFDLGETYSRGKLSDEQVKTTIDKIMELTEHMAQTINVFRDFYKPEKEKKAFRIKESIDRALSFVAPALRFHAIGVELDVDPELFALGYPKEYAQVLLNILANARDAFRDREAGNRLLKISAFAKENKAVVTLTDNGGGINPGIIDKICDIYFTTKESSGGAGVGLYMSKNIIEKNMGGTLSCRNVDQGAEFRIELSIPGDEKTGPCA